MDRETIIFLLIVLALGVAIGFILGGAYEQRSSQMQVCHQINSTLAQYDACINLDYDKFILSLKDGK